MKSILSIVFLTVISQSSFCQLGVNFKFGPSFISSGDINGFTYQVGVNKEIKRNFDVELIFSTDQFEKSDVYYYELTAGGARDQQTEFRHLALVNQLKAFGNFYLINRKFKSSIGIGGSFLSYHTTTPRSYAVFYPLYTGLKAPLYHIAYEENQTKGFAPNAKISFEYDILRRCGIGLNLNGTYFKGTLVWSAPVSFKVRL